MNKFKAFVWSALALILLVSGGIADTLKIGHIAETDHGSVPHDEGDLRRADQSLQRRPTRAGTVHVAHGTVARRRFSQPHQYLHLRRPDHGQLCRSADPSPFA